MKTPNDLSEIKEKINEIEENQPMSTTSTVVNLDAMTKCWQNLYRLALGGFDSVQLGPENI